MVKCTGWTESHALILQVSRLPPCLSQDKGGLVYMV